MNNENSSGIGIFGFIFICLIAWWLYGTYIKKDYSIPWWTGSEYAKVCDASDDTKCYTLLVESNGEVITRVNFPNGGYISPSSTECVKAASFYEFDQFCSITEDDGKEWDVIPLSA